MERSSTPRDAVVYVPRDAAAIAGAYVPRGLEARLARVDWVVLLGLLVLAALLRFVGLESRGEWDSDQGRDLLVLLGIVRDGELPLLGPITSIGGLHHGALWYYLLTPAALVSRADPTVVTATVAAFGTAAVGLTWWLARGIAGSVAGLVAGLLMAVSATSIQSSVVVWNPSLLPFAASGAFASAWHAWSTRSERWWIATGLFAAVAIQSHVLALILVVPLGLLFAADLRRRWSGDREALLGAGGTALAVGAATFAPLIVHEVQSGFAELGAAVEFFTGAGEAEPRPAPLTLALLVVLRGLGWPLAGLVTDHLIEVVVSSVLIVAILAWRARSGGRGEREGMRLVGVAFVAFAAWLFLLAPALATVVPGLPVDQYHAFADPLVFTVAGVGAAALARRGRAGGVLAGVGVGAIVLFNLATAPPLHHPDGSWPDAREAAQRVVEAADGRRIVLLALPEFKPADAYRFPLVRSGNPPVPPTRAEALVVVCDGLFRDAIGAACGGPAEDRLLRNEGITRARLADRFEAAPGRIVSTYLR